MYMDLRRTFHVDILTDAHQSGFWVKGCRMHMNVHDLTHPWIAPGAIYPMPGHSVCRCFCTCIRN